VTLIFDRWLSTQDPSFQPARATAQPSASGHVPRPSTELLPLGEQAAPAGPSLDFVDRLPKNLGRNILAIEAEDHYVRVHTDLGNTLIPGRFSEAMGALHALDGLRVHRSYWVRRSAVASVELQGRGLQLTLTNGLKVPVSHAYKEVARQAGFGRESAESGS
jgi:hypothetical protein